MQKRYDAIPTDSEWKNIEDIANCLISIKTTTEILSGVEYPTVNLALLFRFVILFRFLGLIYFYILYHKCILL